MPKSLLRIADLGPGDVARLVDRAAAFKSDPRQARDLLAGESVVLYFAKPSTRTRVSFETAVHRLGGLPIPVGPADLQMGRGETVEDTARVLSRLARVFVARTFDDDELVRFDAAASIPVVVRPGTRHPGPDRRRTAQPGHRAAAGAEREDGSQ